MTLFYQKPKYCMMCFEIEFPYKLIYKYVKILNIIFKCNLEKYG